MQETWVRSPDQEDPLEEEMATQSSILVWEILWTEEPCRLQSMDFKEKEKIKERIKKGRVFFLSSGSPSWMKYQQIKENPKYGLKVKLFNWWLFFQDKVHSCLVNLFPYSTRDSRIVQLPEFLYRYSQPPMLFVRMCVCVSYSVLSYSLPPHGL